MFFILSNNWSLTVVFLRVIRHENDRMGNELYFREDIFQEAKPT